MGKKHFWRWLSVAGLAAALMALPAVMPVRAEAAARIELAAPDGGPAEGVDVTLTQERYPYKGGERVLPKFTVRYVGKKLVDGTDYKWWTVNAKAVGDATLVIKEIGKYSGQYRTTYRIVRRAAKYVTVRTRYGTYYYTGKARRPAIEASYDISGKTVRLKKGRDYTVTYRNNTNPGIATATVRLRGNYSGTATATFRIKAKDTTPTPTATPRPTQAARPTDAPEPTKRPAPTATPAPTMAPASPTPKAPTPTPTPIPTVHVHHWVEKTETVHHATSGYWHYIVQPPQEPSKALLSIIQEKDENGTPLGHVVKRMKEMCNKCNFITPNILRCGYDHVDQAHHGASWRSDMAVIAICLLDKFWVVTGLPYNEVVVTGHVCTECGAETSQRPATKSHTHEWVPITNSIWHEAQGYFEDYLKESKPLTSLVAPDWKWVPEYQHFQDYVAEAGARAIGGYDPEHDNPVWEEREVCSCGHIFPEDISEGSDGAAEVAEHEAEGHTRAPKSVLTHFNRYMTRFVTTEPAYMEDGVVTAYQCRLCGEIKYPEGFTGEDADYTVHCYQEDKSGLGYQTLMY